MQTDTKSYADFQRIAHHTGGHSGAEVEVDIFAGDGQSCVGFKNLKCKWPSLYARWLIAVAGFHKHAHFMFCITVYVTQLTPSSITITLHLALCI